MAPGHKLITVDLETPAVDTAAPLDERDIQLVQQTLGVAALLGFDTVGKVIFMKVFKQCPEAVRMFSFGAKGPACLEDPTFWATNGPACTHGILFVKTVATAVSLLGSLDVLVPVLQDLGGKHGGSLMLPDNCQFDGPIPEEYDVLAPAVLDALALALGANYTDCVKNAWIKVYTTAAGVMKEAGAASVKKAPPAPAAGALPDFKSPAVDLNAPLDARDVALVQTTLGMVAKLGLNTVAKVIFLKVLKKCPDATQLFSWAAMDAKVMWNDGSPAVAHGIHVVQTVATAVSLLGDLDTLVPILQNLGRAHNGSLMLPDALKEKGVIPQNLDVCAEAVLEALGVALGGNFTEPVKNAWIKVYTTADGVMKAACEEAANPKAVEEPAEQAVAEPEAAKQEKAAAEPAKKTSAKAKTTKKTPSSEKVAAAPEEATKAEALKGA